MELNDYENIDDLHPGRFKGERRKQEELKPEPGVQSAEPVHGKWSPLVIYIILALSILLSVVMLSTAVILFLQIFSGMKTLDADFKMELSQLKSNVTRMSEETRSSLTELGTKISQLKEHCIQWIPFNQKLHYFSLKKTTWKGAQRLCKSMNANLVVINSTEEQIFVQENIEYDHWIGLYDSIEEGKWRWVDGTEYDSNATFWESGQQGNEDEDCVVTTQSGKWHDWPCSARHFMICEKSI
ncbi:hepatic lectin-like [Heterodontus francisci]|uniref:hepatic lectin-like n=1 Tax=Heterodontus francisci TaxID=7792 RepID=UPI00355AFD0C